MTHYLTILGRTLGAESYSKNDLLLSWPYEISVACTALNPLYDVAERLLERYRLQAVMPAPAECFPYPGTLEECEEAWVAPGEIRDAALRFLSVLLAPSPEERELVRQSAFEWDSGRDYQAWPSDDKLDELIGNIRLALQDLADVAGRMERLGEGLAILVLG